LSIFTENGNYSNNAGFNVYANVFESAGKAVFEFHNESNFACSVESVYFDSGSLLEISSITNSNGVSFSQWATPHNLPAGQNLTPTFETTEGFSADSDSPVSKMGINPGEKLQVTFSLQPGKTFAEITQELQNGDLRIGMHVIAFPDGSSESAVTIPEPATLTILGIGGLLFKRQ
jgi:hypothetical protein